MRIFHKKETFTVMHKKIATAKILGKIFQDCSLDNVSDKTVLQRLVKAELNIFETLCFLFIFSDIATISLTGDIAAISP